MKHHDLVGPISPELISNIRTISTLTVVILPIILAIPPFPKLLLPLKSLLTDQIPLDTLIPPEPPSKSDQEKIDGFRIKLWRQLVLVIGGLVGFAGWTVVFGSSLISAIHGDQTVIQVLSAAGMMVVWLFLFGRPMFHPPSTPPASNTIAYLILLLCSISDLSLAAYLRASNGHFPAWAHGVWLSFEITNLVITCLLLYVIAGLPYATPEILARVPMAPDDLVTPATWLSFAWVDKFIRLGNEKELQAEDLPPLSLASQTVPSFQTFDKVKSNKLWKRLAWANRLDLIMAAVFSSCSSILTYAGPFFLKRILDGLTDRTPQALSQAYIYTFLAFLASVLKALTDLLHLWHGRRASVRTKSELIAAIYDKALRRKDASGLIADKESGASDEKKPKEEKKSNADSGKVVNLMAGDANRINMTIAALYWLYTAPIEVIVASTLLYKILGWSAFAGIIVLAIGAPLNSMVSNKSFAITKDLLKARDKRVQVMNELIGAITFIKFFAWGQQWKQRAMDARKEEMRQLVRSLVNGMLFSMIWSLAPILVTLASFFCFIVIQKGELTVSVAFTAISLFSMLRQPLNIIPTFIVMILQCKVSIERVEEFLEENEVPDWVSSLKRSGEAPLFKPRIGFEHATLRWNTGKQEKSDTSKTPSSPKTKTKPTEPTSPTASTSTAVEAVTNGAEEDERFQLSDLTINFPLGKLTVITGPTGSGKTAMLTALLGEMELISGKTYLPKYPESTDKAGLRNSVAYAGQSPWLQQRSIRENILFGEEMDEERYERVLEACALLPDLEVLEDGDMTEIGAKGVSLSGGQKARVALARAIYSYNQQVFLDDPLAAVDSHTARHLTDKCLNGSILYGRTVILVSHHVELLLPSANYIVRILDGRVDAQGTPEDLQARGELDGLVVAEETEVVKAEPIVSDEIVGKEVKVAEDGENGENGESKKEKKKKGPGKKYVQDEERQVGNVKWATYKLYIVAATYTTWVWSIIVLIISQLFAVGERYWLKLWGEAYTTQIAPSFIALPAQFGHHFDVGTSSHQLFYHATNASADAINLMTASWPQNGLPSADSHPIFYLTIYSCIVLGTALLGVVSNITGAWGQYRAAIALHDRLLNTVLTGTIRFFNTTPVGRILNRFTRDIETIDSSLNSGLRTVIVYIASLFGAIAVVAVIVPWFLVPAAIISYLYLQYTIMYLRVGRSLRRLEAVSRSPIYSGFAELLDGVVTVRAFSAETRFMNILCTQVDKMQCAFYYYWMMNRWLLLRFDILGAFSVGLTTLLALSGAVEAGSAGMAILSAQSFVSACYWVSRFWGSLEMDFNAVERVQEYLTIPQEPPAIIANKRPPAYWPSENNKDGFLSVRDLEIKYAEDLPTVFKGSFEVKSGEKIGLIGRTGSGKSTLAMSLLRFTEPYQGSIWLDGINICEIGVDDLRSRITYIPQDAVLFSGTIRLNLDPFDEHTDEELLDALARVNLTHSDTPTASRAPSRTPSHPRLTALAAAEAHTTPPASSLAPTANGTAVQSIANSIVPKKSSITLATEVSAGGSNFSQGQRQLIAMARALLRRSNLIIMDEATASVDFKTDEAIQHAIREEFKQSTLITIAHRLSSVIDYDRLLVLSDGKIAEFDTPINLLRKDDSLFKNLCEKSGKYKELFQAAEKKEKEEQA